MGVKSVTAPSRNHHTALAGDAAATIGAGEADATLAPRSTAPAPDANTPLGEALAFTVATGRRVFFIASTAKVPLKGSHGHLDASADPDTIAGMYPGSDCRWAWRPDADELVIDTDPQNGYLEGSVEFPETETYGPTPHGGQHRVYARNGYDIHSAADVLGDAARGVDFKTETGWLVGYHKASNGARRAPAPAWVATAQAPREATGDFRAADGDALIEDGSRNDYLTRYAGRESTRHTPTEVRALVRAENVRALRHPLDEDELSATIDKSIDRWAQPVSAGVVTHGKRHTADETETDFRIRLTSAADIEPESVEWAWDGRVPLGMITLIVGEGGLGKSMQSTQLAAELSRGTLPGALFGTPVHVAIASAEDTWKQTIIPRLIAAGADRRHVHQVEAIDSDGDPDDIAIDGQIADLERACKAGRIRVLIVDTVVAHIPTTTNTWNEQHVRAVLKPLAHMADRLGLAVVGIMHLNRREARDVLTRISGSGGFGNLARSVLLFAPDPHEPEDSLVRILAHAKCNVGRLQPTLRMRITEQTIDGRITTAHLVADGESELTTAELLTPRDKIKAAPEAEDVSALDKAERFLKSRLRGKLDGVPIKEIKAEADAKDIMPHTLRRAREALQVDAFAVAGTMPTEWRYRWFDPDATPADYKTDREATEQTLEDAIAKAEAEAADAA